MPRTVHATRVLPKLVTKPVSTPKIVPVNLWNAKRKIQGSRGLSVEQLKHLKANPLSESWRNHVSPDVREFVDDLEANGRKLLPEDKLKLFESPARYFSRPHNVPTYLRKQVYFPDFTVTLRRCNLGPYYVQFTVPLWFSKLDLKGYLKDIYNVDVVHVRSYVEPSKVQRKNAKHPGDQGELYREPSAKRMTVQLVEPFTWPAEPSEGDLEPFQGKAWWKMAQNQLEESKKEQDYFRTYVNYKHRSSIANQARDIIAGKEKWEPTWKSLPADVKAMYGTAVPDSKTQNQVARR